MEKKVVLIVVRTLTCCDRVRDILPLCDSDRRLEIHWVVEPGSAYRDGVDDYLKNLDVRLLRWAQARRRRFDLILAAHVDRRLGRLRGPIFVFPHGAGFNRILPKRTKSVVEPVGLSRHEHRTLLGRLVASVVGLSHPDQKAQLANAVPGAEHRSRVIGDPTFDRITANMPLREEFRRGLGVAPWQRLVVVTSTWGDHCLVKSPGLVDQLLSQLPQDEFKVALVLHPNVWRLHGEATVRAHFRDALDSGLLLLKHDDGWQVGIVAGDICIGDHGSVAFYAAALGRPFLKAVAAPADLLRESPTARFIEAATPVDRDSDLHQQILGAMSRHDPAELIAITAKSLGLSGDNGVTFQRTVYELLDLTPPALPRVLRYKAPQPIIGDEMVSVLLTLDVSATNANAGRVDIRRYPVILERHHPPDDRRDYVLLGKDTEVDTRLRQSAEIVVSAVRLGEQEALGWMKARLESTGVKLLVAALSDTRCVLRLRDGPLFEANTTPLTASGTSPPDPWITAAAVYAWLVEGGTFDQPVDLVIRLTDSPMRDIGISVTTLFGSALTP
ncbi:hypothetical protein [Umezawaea tangerina]|uniref:hypothetical protein n=1 Tax=Umezawaea tangerina TaxID=84725 RepID=UPI000B12406C|nr:hypothetical protein [Umezawaea tangerina]